MKNRGIVGVAIASALVLVAIFTLSEDETPPTETPAGAALTQSGVADAVSLAGLNQNADRVAELEAKVAGLTAELASAKSATAAAPASSDRLARLETQLADARQAKAAAQAELAALRAETRGDDARLATARSRLDEAERRVETATTASAARIAGLEGTLKIRSDRLAAVGAAPVVRGAPAPAVPTMAVAAPPVAGGGASERALTLQNTLRQQLSAARREAARTETLERELAAARADVTAARQEAAARIAGLEGTLKIRSERAGFAHAAAPSAPRPAAATGDGRLTAALATAASASARAMELQGVLRARMDEATADAARIETLERDLAEAQARTEATRQQAAARIAGLEGTMKIRADRAGAVEEQAQVVASRLASAQSRLAHPAGADPAELRRLQLLLRRGAEDIAEAEGKADRIRAVLIETKREAEAAKAAATARIAGLEATLKIRTDRLRALDSAALAPNLAPDLAPAAPTGELLKAATPPADSDLENRAMFAVVSAQQREIAEMRGVIAAMRDKLATIENRVKSTD